MVINTTTLAFQQTFMWLFTIFSSLLLVYQGLDEKLPYQPFYTYTVTTVSLSTIHIIIYSFHCKLPVVMYNLPLHEYLNLGLLKIA